MAEGKKVMITLDELTETMLKRNLEELATNGPEPTVAAYIRYLITKHHKELMKG